MRQKALYLGIILLIVVVIVAIVVGGSESKEQCIDPTLGVPAARALTEAHVDGIVTSMQIMALTDEVKSADWDTISPLLAEFEDGAIPLVAWFVLPDGSYYTVDAGLASGNLSDREYFPVVMGGEVVIGDLVVSKSTGKESAVVTVPVKDGNDVIGALGASIYLDDLSQLIVDDLQLSSDMVFYAINGDDVIALHSDTEMIMQNASEIDELPCLISYSSSLLDWTFAIGYECQ
ncbi:MAG: hypothetical protein WC455_01660 [Dehalococcoidia bacterium]|jgi:hypothetical protein